MFDAGSLRKLKLPAVLALALVILGGGYYLLLAIKRTTYLTNSNIRLLTTIGHQFDDWLQRQEEIFRIVIGDKDPEKLIRGWKSAPTFKIRTPRPPEGAAELELEPPTLVLDSSGKMSLELESIWGDKRTVPFDAPILEALGKDAFDAVLLVAPDGRILKQSGPAALYLPDLGPMVAPRDSAVKKDSATEAKKTGQTSDIEDLAGINYRLFIQPCCSRVRVQTGAGQPATKTLQATAGADSRPATPRVTASPGKPGAGESGDGAAVKNASGTTGAGLFVCGLVPSATLMERRFAVSFSTMLIIAGILLMLVVSWPFMKLALIGNRQRIRLLDVLLLAISSVLVLSIGTLYLLDSYAYTRLETQIDEGLQTFSSAIQSNMRREIAAAYSQLRELQTAARTEGLADVLTDALECHSKESNLSYYPFFDTFSLIDSKGLQKVKWSIRQLGQSTPRIPVKEREYFKRVSENRTWSLPKECDTPGKGGGLETCLPAIDRFAFESTRSITRMSTQAVLAIPNESSGDKLPVAALAIPMMSLIKPVVAPGFGYAVIEDEGSGRVMFHSDQSRNLIEQFFLETDMDKRLRSVVAARRAELLDLRYWGKDYRAYVTPLRGFPWSLVTFYDKERARSVNVDSVVTTLLFLIPYMLGCFAVCLAILIQPQKRTTFLWPHPRSLSAYFELDIFYVVLICIFGVTIHQAVREVGGSRASDWPLILFAFMFPALAWFVTYLRLRGVRSASPIAGDEVTDPTQDSGEKAWPEPNQLLALSYIGGAALLLIVTAAMPTAAFFKLAHSIQIVPFIKYNQVKLVAGLEERRQQAEKEAATSLSPLSRSVVLSTRGKPATISALRAGIGGAQLNYEDENGIVCPIPPVDIYCQPFGTSVVLDGGGAASYPTTDSFPAFLEPYLPYYSDSSVERRELLHDETADKSRSWKHESGNRIVLTSGGYGDGALEVSSVVPTFGGLQALFQEGRLAIILIFGVIGALALAITVFTARRVFLLDMPFWSSGTGGFAPPGRSIFVVCRRAELRKAYLAGRLFEKLDLAELASPAVKAEAWDAALSEVEKTLSDEPILLDHFEEGSSDGRLSAKKLWLVKRLVGIRHRRLVILSSAEQSPLQHGGLPDEPGSKADEGASIEQEWASLLTSDFVVINLDPRYETEPAAPRPGRMTTLQRALGTGWRAVSRDVSAWVRVRQYREIRRVLERECAGNPYLTSIHDDLDRMIRRRGEEGLDKEEVLAEIEERASNYYEALWACCSPVEKIALEHLAEDGFANYRDGKVIRRLIARGLVRRDPHLRLMNETFRRYVVSTDKRKEVAELEKDTQPSAWDYFRRPFGVILTLVVVIFAATQKERFDATMALILGATGVLPSLLKLAGLLVGEKSPLPAKPS